jgi:glycosyltransferase involved in cell wall biosynthesis
MTESKTVHIFLPHLGAGGAQRVMVNLANSAVDEGLNAKIILMSAGGRFENKVRSEVKVVSLECERAAYALPGLLNYIKRHKPETIISTQVHANLNLVLAKLVSRTPFKAVIREPTSPSAFTSTLSSAQQKTAKRKLAYLLSRYAYGCADKIISVSKCARDGMLDRFYGIRGKVEVLPNLTISEKVIEDIESTSNRKTANTSVVAAGRLDPVKGFDDLIRAFRRVVDMVSFDCQLTILGEGEDRNRLEKIRSSLNLSGHVELPGFTDSPYSYFKDADVFVLSSLAEGCPNVLIEAMACEATIVSTDCKCGPREILEDGRWGTLVGVGNTSEMAYAIEAAIGKSSPDGIKERAMNYSTIRSFDKYRDILL